MLFLFAVRSFSLGRTVTRMNALAVIRTPRRTGVKPRTCKEELGEECSKTERWKRLNYRLTVKPQTIHHDRQKKCIQILAFIAMKAIKVRLQFHLYCKSLLVKISIPLLPSCTNSAKRPHISNYFIVQFSNDRFILTVGFTKNDLTWGNRVSV